MEHCLHSNNSTAITMQKIDDHLPLPSTKLLINPILLIQLKKSKLGTDRHTHAINSLGIIPVDSNRRSGSYTIRYTQNTEIPMFIIHTTHRLLVVNRLKHISSRQLNVN